MTSTLTAPTALDPTVDHPSWCSPEHHEDAGLFDHLHYSRPTVLILDDDLPSDRSIVTASIEQRISGGVGNWAAKAPVIRLLVDSGETTHSDGTSAVGLTANDVVRLSRLLVELQATIDATG